MSQKDMLRTCAEEAASRATEEMGVSDDKGLKGRNVRPDGWRLRKSGKRRSSSPTQRGYDYCGRAEHRIRTSAQNEMEKIWKDRMEKEDKIITTNKSRDIALTGRPTECASCLHKKQAPGKRCKHSGNLHWQRWEHEQLCCPRDAKHLCAFPHRIESLGGLQEHPMDEARNLVSKKKKDS